MPDRSLVLRYAARSHVGMVRAKNDDSAYAGKFLAVVADGMGGHAGGDVASASTVLDLVHLDRDGYTDDAGTHLADEIQTANSLLSELVHVNPKLAGMGTTVTALLLSQDRLAYAHIGDSRAYRLKNGVFEQISKDHTFVQRMIEEGRMTAAEAEHHPHKNVLMRVLGDVDASPELDLDYFDADVGERWLLCSDGLNFVRPDMIEDVVRHTKSLATCADTLIELTLAAGSPDNVTVVVFEVAEDTGDDTPTAALDTVPLLEPADGAGTSGSGSLRSGTSGLVTSGSASSRSGTAGSAPSGSGHGGSDGGTGSGGTGRGGTGDAGRGIGGDGPEPDGSNAAGDEVDSAEAEDDIDLHIRVAVVRQELAMRPHELVGAAVTANEEGKIPLLAGHPATRRAATVLTHKPADAGLDTEDEVEQSIPLFRHRKLVLSIVAAVIVVAVVAGSWIGYAWTQTQYYVGVSNGNVAIFKGVSQSLGPIALSHVQQETGVSVESLPEYSQQRLQQTLPANSLGDARQIVSDLKLGTGSSTPPCPPGTTPVRGAAGSATAAPTATAKPSGTGKPSASDKPTAGETSAPMASPSAGTSTPSASHAAGSPSPAPATPSAGSAPAVKTTAKPTPAAAPADAVHAAKNSTATGGAGSSGASPQSSPTCTGGSQ